MNFSQKIAQFKRLDDLIRRKTTGTLDDLAHRFAVSKSTMSRHLDEMREELNAPISYDRLRITYYYDAPFDLNESFDRLINGYKKNVL